MEEEDACEHVPMDIDEDPFGPHLRETVNVAELEEHALKHVAGWLMKVKGKKRIRDIDPWEGFESPQKYSTITRAVYEYSKDFTLDQLTKKNCPFSIRASACQRKREIATGDGYMYFPFQFAVKRWDNQSGVDLGCALIRNPLEVMDLASEVVNNIPGGVPGAFMVMKDGSTQDTAKSSKGQVPDGIAIAQRHFGTLSHKFLEAFGCLRPEHLTRGCLEVDSDIVLEARLQDVFRALRERTFIPTLGPTRKQKNETRREDSDDDDLGESRPMDTSECNDRFYLVPCSSLLAWIYNDMDDPQRAKFHVYAIQIRSRNKKDNTIKTPYWIVDDPSFAWMLKHARDALIGKVRPLRYRDIGIKIFPFKSPETWGNPMVVEGWDPRMDRQENQALYQKKRRFGVKFYASYVAFPADVLKNPKLAPILPDDWYDPKEFARQMAVPGLFTEETVPE